jgi:hypothetical protein
MLQCDTFAIVDHVQFLKKSFQNRNYIRGKSDKLLLTVPVLTKGRFTQRICDVEVEGTLPWARKHWKSMYLSYRDAPFFSAHAGFFEAVYSRSWPRLLDLNVEIMVYLMKQLRIEKSLVYTSRLGVVGEKTDMLLDMCRKLGFDTYVSGWGGKNYVNLDLFRQAGLHHRFVKLAHPVYNQQGDEFIANLSAVDLLFNCGPDSRRIIDEAGMQSITEVM